jgi:hypothetical protein
LLFVFKAHYELVSRFLKERQAVLQSRTTSKFMKNVEDDQRRKETLDHKRETQRNKMEHIQRKLQDLTKRRESLEFKIQKDTEYVVMGQQVFYFVLFVV